MFPPGFIPCLEKKNNLSCYSALLYKMISFTAGILDTPWWNNYSNAKLELNRSDFYSFEQEVSSLLSYLLTTHKKKSYLPYGFLIFHMLIEEILSPIKFVTKWTSISLSNAWLLLFINISRKLSTVNEYFKIPTFFMDDHYS